MKRSEKFGVWRPAGAAILVGALAFAVGAYAAPRPSDDARTAGKSTNVVRSDAAQLVTGNPAQVQEIVAGTPPTLVIRVVPIPANVGAYPAGTSISGNTLTAFAGGFRAWFEEQIGDWDPAGDGTTPDHPGTVQCKIDGSGYSSGSGGPLTRPAVACGNNAACVAAFGDGYAKCELGTCKDAYADKAAEEANSYCSDFGSGPCNQGDCNTASANLSCFAITEAPRPDDGSFKSFAHLVVDVPGDAAGLYTIALVEAETYAASSTSPPEELQSLAEIGFAINIQTGSCCHNLGSPTAGCTDGLLKGDCEVPANAPFFWSAGDTCDNPPTSDGCKQCLTVGTNTDPLCNDNDACTDNVCTPIFTCVYPDIAGFDPSTECCNPSDASQELINDNDVCTDDSCSLPNSRGVAVNDPDANSCDDGNPCTHTDVCDGVHTEAEGGCQGSDVNAVPCTTSADCPVNPLNQQNFDCVEGLCFCTLTPNVRFVLSGPRKVCDGGFNDGGTCGADSDCPGGGVCDNHADGANCYDTGEKINATVHMGSAGSPINGGQFLITYDASCVQLTSIAGVGFYTTTVYGPVYGAGSVFIAVGVDPFEGINGPLGNADILALTFTKVGDCDSCDLCFANNNPQNTYLVDDEGQKVEIEGKCKSLRANGDLSLDVPGNVKTNVDCDKPTAVVTWDAPSASFSCGTASLSCRGAYEDGTNLNGMAMGGGQFPRGASSFCCYAAANDPCDQAVGCPGAANDCAIGADNKPVGCWTVTVNDETSLDIDVQLEPPMAGGELTRCIKFCLYSDCVTAPFCFEDDVTFGGLFNFTGKTQSKVKVPRAGQWDCITAQDQLHTLRSCASTQEGNMRCVDGQLQAEFEGDPELGGNWLIGGNLDGFKAKENPAATSPFTIDIIDFGTFLSEYGEVYGSGDTLCGTEGPNGDINGDGFAGLTDYAYILRNFLASAKNCCCEGSTSGDFAPANPITEISVAELRQLGLSDLAVADLNGDGVVNGEDMDAFMQGARPSKSGNGRGGKGLRSGR